MRMLEFEQRKEMLLFYAKISFAEYVGWGYGRRRYSFAEDWAK